MADETPKPEEEVKWREIPLSRRIPAFFLLICFMMFAVAATGVAAGIAYKLFMTGFHWAASL